MNTTVVVGYDRSVPSDRALGVAAREAERRGASLSVITAYYWPAPPEPESPTSAGAEAAARKAAEEMAGYAAEAVRQRHPALPVEPHAVAGHAAKVLAGTSHAADLVVVGNRGAGGFPELEVGSTSLRTVAEACCPVLVVRGDASDGHGRIVAAVDIDESCERVLEFAFDEAARRGAGLTATYVWDEPWILAYGQEDPGVVEDIARLEREAEDRLAALVRSIGERHPTVDAFHQIATGSAAELLVDDSRHADLLVTGARRHTEGRHGMLLGPVTQALLHHAECPVAVVPLS